MGSALCADRSRNRVDPVGAVHHWREGDVLKSVHAAARHRTVAALAGLQVFGLAGEVGAAEAGIKTLNLTHFVPTGGPADRAELWREGAKKGFDGEIVVGADLMELRP